MAELRADRVVVLCFECMCEARRACELWREREDVGHRGHWWAPAFWKKARGMVIRSVFVCCRMR